MIDDAINEWVKTIPINSAETDMNKEDREHLIKNLAIKLKEMAEDDDFNDKSKAEIKKCVNDISISETGNEEQQEILKNKIVESLCNKMRNLKSKDLIYDKVVTEPGIDSLNGKGTTLKIPENKEDNFSKHVKKEIDDSPEKFPTTFDGIKNETVPIRKLINKQEKKLPDELINSNDETRQQKYFKNIRSRTNKSIQANGNHNGNLPTETVENINTSLSEVLLKEKETKRKEAIENNIRLKIDIDTAIRKEIKMIMDDWSNKMATLESSMYKNSMTEKLPKQLIETKPTNIKEQKPKLKENEDNNPESKSLMESVVCREVQKIINDKNKTGNRQSIVGVKMETETSMEQLSDLKYINTNIEESIDQLQANNTVELITKLSEILINDQSEVIEQSQAATIVNGVNEAVPVELENLIIDWSTELKNIQNSVDKYVITILTKQILEATSANVNIIDLINEIQNIFKRFLGIIISQHNTEISNTLKYKIQNLEKLLGDKFKQIIEQSHLNNYNTNQKQNISSLDNEQGMTKQVMSANIRQASSQTRSESLQENKSHKLVEESKRYNDNIPKNITKRMEAIKDISYGHNMNPNEKLRKNKDKHSITDPPEDTTINVNINVKNEIGGLLKHILHLQNQSFDQDVILEEIYDWFDTISKKSKVDILLKEREAITKKLLEYLEHNKPRKRWDKNEDKNTSFVNDVLDFIDAELLSYGKNQKNTKNKTVSILERRTDETNSPAEKMPDGDLKDIIREELKEMLEQHRVELTNKELEDMIPHMLEDQILRGVYDDKSKEKVYTMLQEDNIPTSIAADISMRLSDRVREMSLAHKAKDSSMALNKTSTISPFHNDAFKNNAERVILGFIDEFTNDRTLIQQTNFKEITKELVALTSDILSEPNENTEDRLKDEIWNYFNNISFQSNTPVLDLVDELSDRVLSIVINTSTPRKEKRSIQLNKDGKQYFLENRQNNNTSENKDIPKAINEVSNSVNDLCPCDTKKIKTDYNTNLTKIISNWTEEIPIINGKLKFYMIKDLVSHIYDRQKYLKLTPRTKTSDEEELEHLKYQIFRWLHNLPGFSDFSSFIPGIESLMQKIKAVNVPVLIKGTKNIIEVKILTLIF